MSELKHVIAEKLLAINAVILNPDEPFTWSSGLKAPIYCDNRLTLSYPDVRSAFADALSALVRRHFPDAEVIAGTATAGIPHAAWVSERLRLPMVYVRSSAKAHGKKKQIEGLVPRGLKVVVIEDLISTGASVLAAVAALRKEGAQVLGAAAIFTYGLNGTAERFEAASVPYHTLTDFFALIEVAKEKQVIDDGGLRRLEKWHRAPDGPDWRVG